MSFLHGNVKIYHLILSPTWSRGTNLAVCLLTPFMNPNVPFKTKRTLVIKVYNTKYRFVITMYCTLFCSNELSLVDPTPKWKDEINQLMHAKERNIKD